MKRRQFILTGLASTLIPALGRAQQPCAPPTLSVDGGSSSTTPCVAGSAFARFSLTSSKTQTLAPFTIGHPFRRGDVPMGSSIVASVPNFQADIKNRWSDGSVKFAILSGRLNLTPNTPATIELSSDATSASGAAPTLAQLRTIVTDGRVAFSGGVSGTVDVPALINTAPFRSAYNSGPQMTEWHWRSRVGSDLHLEVWLFVRLYTGGHVELEVCVENGGLLIASPITKNYTVTVAYNGTQRYSGTLSHYYQSRWSRVDWYGPDPDVTPSHNRDYLRSTLLVPNYHWTAISSAALNALNQSYAPLTLPNLPTEMGNAGAQPTIGLLMQVDAMYVTSNGDSRAYKAVMAAGRGLGTYQTHFRDETTNLPLAFASYPTLCANQNANNIGANPSSTTGSYTPQGSGAQSIGTWDFPHAPAPGYMAYLISGRRLFLDELQLVTTAHYLATSNANRQNGSCVFSSTAPGTVRGAAWNLRTLAMTAAVTPDDEPIRLQFQNAWAANMQFYSGTYVTGSLNGGRYVNQLGAVLSYQTNGKNVSEYNPGGGHLFMAAWMQAFLGASIGFAWDMEPTTDATSRNNHRAFRDFLYKHAAGLAGDDTGFNYRRGGPYAVPYTQTESSDPISWYPNWAALKTAYEQYYGLVPISGTGALKRHSSDMDLSSGDSSTWPEGFWANMMPALAYAVEHDAPKAAEGLARIKASPSWAFTEACNDNPVWGIQPR